MKKGNLTVFLYRLIFSKTGYCRFIGHLDLQSVFQRAIKRAGLPVVYSFGFNPHQEIIIAQPLPVGMYGENEFLEIYLKTQISADEIISKLNGQLPEGIFIKSAVELSDGEKTAASTLSKAEYEIIIPFTEELFDNTNKKITEINISTEYVVNKKSKSGIKAENIKNDIFLLTCNENSIKIVINCILSCGSVKNLKPETVVLAIFGELPGNITYYRKRLILG